MKVLIRNPNREIELSGRRRVKELLRDLGILPDTVLVIRGKELLTSDAVVGDDDVVELRPVISGGSFATGKTGTGVRGSESESRTPNPESRTPAEL